MTTYSLVSKGATDGDDRVESDHDEPLLREKYDSRPTKWPRFTRGLIGIQFVFILILILEIFLLNHQYSSCIRAPRPPYSPLYDDGAVKYINKDIHYNPLFQHETSPELEEAWEKPIREYDRALKIPSSMAANGLLPESIELFLDPGYSVYAVAVYHQYHCLNRIRKSFYPEKFFPNQTRKDIDFHKSHCFDVLRQSILCNGDPSLVYWWNQNYSYIDERGQKHYTEEYLRRSPQERMKGSFVKWDVPTQCRDLDAINRWISQHVVGQKYGDFFEKDG